MFKSHTKAMILVLLLKIHATKSCAGISLKTQELYLIVFCTRYVQRALRRSFRRGAEGSARGRKIG